MDEMENFKALVSVELEDLNMLSSYLTYKRGGGIKVSTMVRSGTQDYLIPMLMLIVLMDMLPPQYQVKLMVLIETLNAERPEMDDSDLPF